MLTRSGRKRILKITISKSTAPLAAIENAARVIENSSETPLLAGCGVKENSQPILAGCEVREIGEPLLAGCADTGSLARSEAKQK